MSFFDEEAMSKPKSHWDPLLHTSAAMSIAKGTKGLFDPELDLDVQLQAIAAKFSANQTPETLRKMALQRYVACAGRPWRARTP